MNQVEYSFRSLSNDAECEGPCGQAQNQSQASFCTGTDSQGNSIACDYNSIDKLVPLFEAEEILKAYSFGGVLLGTASGTTYFLTEAIETVATVDCATVGTLPCAIAIAGLGLTITTVDFLAGYTLTFYYSNIF